MTKEKKEETVESDWGVEKPKSGIAIETKVGLCLIFILLSAFGLVVYQKINRPQESLAAKSQEEELPEATDGSDPFSEGASGSGTTINAANSGDGQVADSGFSTPQDAVNQGNPFQQQQSGTQEADQFAQNTFENQSEAQQNVEIAANRDDNGFQQFDPSPSTSNEFANSDQNEFQTGMQNQSEPATFNDPQSANGAEQTDPFSEKDQFTQQPTQTAQNLQQQNDFNVQSQSRLLPEPDNGNSGLVEQPGGNEFAQSATGTNPSEKDPFGAAPTEQGQAMQEQAQQSAENEFGNFDLTEESNSAQMQNPEELSANSTKVKITDISSSSEMNSFEDAGFAQEGSQSEMALKENTFSQEGTGQNLEQAPVSEFNEGSMNQSEERFGNFRPEAFTEQQAESVTTVKRPAAAIDSGTFRDSEQTAQQVPQAQGLFDRHAPVQEISNQQQFDSFQRNSLNQQQLANTRGEYTVQNGENFWTISKKLYGSGRYFQLLAEINKSRVSDPQKMRPGVKLIAPDRETINAQYQARHKSRQTIVREFPGKGTVPKPGKPSGFFISQDGRPMYRVGSSDTLTDISQRHLGRSSRWFQIYQINRQKLQNPNKLQIGTELQLPYDASSVSLVPANSSSR